jgi:hypothetical protein
MRTQLGTMSSVGISTIVEHHFGWLKDFVAKAITALKGFKDLPIFLYPLRSADLDQLFTQWSNLHCNEAHIIAKLSARRELLHFFDDLVTELKCGQFTAPIHSF